MEYFLIKNCLILREPGANPVRADVRVENGVVRIAEAGSLKEEEDHVYECRDNDVVAPCLFVGWMLPLAVNESVCHRELFELLGRSPEELPFSIRLVKVAISELIKYGVCGAVVSAPPTYSVEDFGAIAEKASMKVLFNIIVDVDGRLMDSSLELLGRLRERGLAAGLEIANASLAAEDTLRKAARAAASLGVRLYLHSSYAKREVYESKKRWGLFPIERFYRLGLLSERTILVGSGWISSWELGYAAEKGSPIVYVPAHDMLHCLGGHFPLHEALQGGVKVWLGLGFTTASIDPLRLLWAALLLQRYVYWDDRITAADVLKTALLPSPLFSAPARIEDGEEAWFVVYRVEDTGRVLPVSLDYALLRGAKPVLVFAGGRLVYKGSELF
jgi:cytosine/adenosine deaminase-related metal-dependent hydrolase